MHKRFHSLWLMIVVHLFCVCVHSCLPYSVHHIALICQKVFHSKDSFCISSFIYGHFKTILLWQQWLCWCCYHKFKWLFSLKLIENLIVHSNFMDDFKWFLSQVERLLRIFAKWFSAEHIFHDAKISCHHFLLCWVEHYPSKWLSLFCTVAHTHTHKLRRMKIRQKYLEGVNYFHRTRPLEWSVLYIYFANFQWQMFLCMCCFAPIEFFKTTSYCGSS